MSTAEVEAVRDLAARASAADGVAPLNEETLFHLTDPGQHLLLLGEGDGKALLGYGHVEGGSAELVVDPGSRRRGHGLTLAQALSSAGTAFWAHGSLPGTAELGARLGLVAVRELLLMGRELTDLPERPLTGDVTVRKFEVGRDEAAWLALNAAAFASHPEQGSWTAEDLALRQDEPWFDPADLLLAERDGVLVASHWTKIVGPDEPGEVYVVAVDPAAQGGGLGTAVLLAGLAHLQQRGCRRVVLYVDADNAAAVHVYRRWGFTTLSTDTSWATPDPSA